MHGRAEPFASEIQNRSTKRPYRTRYGLRAVSSLEDMKCRVVLLAVVLLAVLISVCDAKRKRKRMSSKAMVLRRRETNAVDFIRLAVMRLIYGIATRIGFGEQISEALNGAFVPPGVDDYSDYGGGFDLLDREDDYDY